VDVHVERMGDNLRVVVADDGVGGAEARPGRGLAGLADRASSIEGSLTLASPAGGPTVLTAELPCGS
jgi:signal transduction histidine kinase